MSDLEAAAEAVTVGVVARAVEPGAGEADSHTHENACLNCGQELAGEYCHSCGQHAHVHRTISAWWHDFLHSVLHLDGKFWRTVPMLVWHPGKLTRRYARGQRARFVSPLALFLFTVFLMFALFSVVWPNMGDLGVSRTVEQGLKAEQETLRELEAKRAQTRDPAQAAKIDEKIAEARENVELLADLQKRGVTNASFASDSEDVQGDAIFKAAYKKAKQNPELLVYKLQANAYKYSWALIPISIPFVWILFLHRRRYRREFGAYDHLVFVTYSIAFMSLTLIAAVLLSKLGLFGDLLGIAFLLVPPMHMYRQLRGAYSLSRFSAGWRTLALMIFTSIALSLFAALLLMLGLLG